MKVITEEAGYEWHIIEGDKIVGEIRLETGYKWRLKKLYIGDYFISEVKNKNDAIKKLEQFFIQNKRDIEDTERTIECLVRDLGNVNHELSINAIRKLVEFQKERLELFKSLDLM